MGVSTLARRVRMSIRLMPGDAAPCRGRTCGGALSNFTKWREATAWRLSRERGVVPAELGRWASPHSRAGAAWGFGACLAMLHPAEVEHAEVHLVTLLSGERRRPGALAGRGVWCQRSWADGRLHTRAPCPHEYSPHAWRCCTLPRSNMRRCT